MDAVTGAHATLEAAPPTTTRDEQDPAQRHIHGRGTPEQAWRASSVLQALRPLTLDVLAPAGARVVVVAPHPDDEILGCGGALAMLAHAGRELVVVGVTDGEASHAGSPRWTPGRLARQRRAERQAGLAQLGVGAPTRTLGIPDGAVAAAEDALTSALEEMLRPGDVVLTTWRLDGHPDHEATGRASVRAARARDCHYWEMPIWMWHWARPDDPAVPWHLQRRLDLDADASVRKHLAIAAHASQLEAIVEEQRAAVLPEWALARVLRPFEVFFETPEQP